GLNCNARVLLPKVIRRFYVLKAEIIFTRNRNIKKHLYFATSIFVRRAKTLDSRTSSLLVVCKQHYMASHATLVVKNRYILSVWVNIFKRVVPTISIFIQSIRRIHNALIRHID